jgi:ribosomal protein S7
MSNYLFKNLIKSANRKRRFLIKIEIIPSLYLKNQKQGLVFFNQNLLKGNLFFKKLKHNVFHKKGFFRRSNRRFSIHILREIFFKGSHLKSKKSFNFIVKSLFSKNISNFEINFYIKKLILSFLYKIVSQFKCFKNLITKGRPSVFSNLQIYLKMKCDAQMLKKLLFLINTEGILKRKVALYIQKKFFLFLVKNKKSIVNANEKVYLNKLLVAYFKQIKKLTFTKKIFVDYKKTTHISYLKKKKNINSILYKKLVGLVNKCGNKSRALKIIETTLHLVHLRLKMPINLVLYKTFMFLKSSVESKKVRVRRSFHFVPFPINSNRKSYLVAKWIFFSIKKSKLKKSIVEKLYLEFFKILKTKRSASYKSRKYNIYKSLQNKSNSHFRW